jgi:hypothetical protein
MVVMRNVTAGTHIREFVNRVISEEHRDRRTTRVEL